MSTIAVIGATGYAGSHIVEEALRRGHSVLAASRTAPAETRGGVTVRPGSVFDPAFVAALAAEADVLVVAVKAKAGTDGALADAVPVLLSAAAEYSTRLGVVGGAGSLLVAEGGPRLIDTPEFPAVAKEEATAAADVLDALRASSSRADWFLLSPASLFGAFAPGERTGRFRLGGDVALTGPDGRSVVSGADYAIAFVDEIEEPAHHRVRFSVAY